MIENVAFLLVSGSVALFMVGFGQVTGSLGRRVSATFRKTLTDAHPGKVQRFFAGMRLAALSGSNAAGVVALITIADGNNREIDDASWILLGINLGGTITCWVLALLGFRVTLAPVALAMLAITIPFRWSSALPRQTAADVLVGVALLILGIELATGRIPVHSEPVAFITAMERGALAGSATLLLSAFAVGLVVSLGLRSSVGTVFLAMALATRGWLPFGLAATIVLAGNAGPAVTTWAAARRFGPAARRTAATAFLINGLAIILGGMLFVPLSEIVAAAVPGSDAPAAAVRLALFHTIVHVLTIPVIALLHKSIQSLAAHIVPGNTSSETGHCTDSGAGGNPPEVHLLPTGFPDSLEANLIITRSALATMADRAYEMLMIVINVSQMEDGVQDETDRAIALRSLIKDLEEQVSVPLTRSVQLPCTRTQAERIQQQQRIAQELSLIADDCYKAMRLLERSYRKNYRFHQESREELFDFTSQILDFLRYNSDYLEGRIDQPDWDVAERMEETIDKVRDKLKKRSRKVLEKSDDADIRGELVFVDIISHLEHVGDRCLNIADTVRRVTVPQAPISFR